ncbi:Cytochrome c-type biogenesis protein ccmH [Roseomonas mucosa]|uniref:cytochrome c-type biogenesis protein n=1 Tax=Roseomonas mucosa TaxID=207340 RepID=UPI002207D50A|nr:cytochrome c-type biogenesis protein [Roseomonas mucosa]QDJ08170.1 Cytochrome c-type biogenesis protein ccmH [Roseomonas mucosa]
MIRRLLPALPLLALLLSPAALSPAWAIDRPEDLLPDPAQEERAREIGRELRCMVCQNQSIEDSDADLAHQLRHIVREQVAAGRSDEDIVRFLHDRYGDFVLLRPPVNGATLLLWATPALALMLGVGTVLLLRRRRPAALPQLSEAERRRLAEIEGEAQAGRPASREGGAA